MTRRQKIIAWLVLTTGTGLFLFGCFHAREVYVSQEALEAGIDMFDTITEFDVVEDATFDGIRRQDGKLYSTYDRTAADGKRVCPT